MGNSILRKDAIGVRLDAIIKENGVAVDLSPTTTKNYLLTKPDGTLLTKGASFITTGVDGRLRYTTASGDLDIVGEYKWQVDLVFPGGYDGPTDIGTFWVEANLN